ncbi:protein translocase subunit SecD [Streptomyces alkaliterrae]|uniref:Protein translocase subunit SecD n=1 Tax=Streptomyces alkaliterrae TaxID=2213162 RepID=A0A5P0YRY0_9ACTN|nr:protein translocase subunit SecD [Streptomyces alkaliterrae]MBB1255946.1 protein translocase subunit SecD [Streptomyces alkaliterrae]MBB1260375.1 protein translocase subunit SecD [Streptomyces alkaliterrae]MQS02202.1 protein translocase subunit SecD [Streptomyces alkaliterrae]
MATPRRRRSSTGAQGRPLRPLLLALTLIAVLTGGMFLSGATTPRLGIDLAGGTSITLTAKDQPGKGDAVNEANMKTAASIIDRRVNGLGVSEAEVTTQGDRNIVVNIPRGTNEKQAREQVGTTAELGFRKVLTAGDATPPPGAGAGEQDTDGKKDDKPADDKPADDKADKSDGKNDAEASPSNEPSTQGARAGAVNAKANETPSPSPSPTDGADQGEKDEETPSDQPPAEGGIPADVIKRFEQLDCTTPAARAKANRMVAESDPGETVAACDREGVAKYVLGPIEVPGTDVDGANAGFDPQRAIWVVSMEFSNAGSKKFARVTDEIKSLAPPQNQFAITLDGEVVSAPRVSQRIAGSAEITGSFTQEEAQDLANILKFGALPISFEEANVLTISPTLGGEQLKAGLIAGAIGLALVVAYLLFYYRALGFVAILSLAAMGGFTYVIMSLLGPAIGFALSLPAICGAIVAIGITADSFIVYFERIRDEVRDGRSVRTAIERAWPRARHTILISDVVSFLAAVVLFFAAVGSVQGFAFVLGLTTLLDIVVVFLITKPLTSLMVQRPFFANGHRWSGLDAKRLGAQPPIRGRRRTPVTAEPKEA